MSNSPERLDGFWIEEEDLVEPVTDEFVSIEDSGLALGDVPRDALTRALPVVPFL